MTNKIFKSVYSTLMLTAVFSHTVLAASPVDKKYCERLVNSFLSQSQMGKFTAPAKDVSKSTDDKGAYIFERKSPHARVEVTPSPNGRLHFVNEPSGEDMTIRFDERCQLTAVQAKTGSVSTDDCRGFFGGKRRFGAPSSKGARSAKSIEPAQAALCRRFFSDIKEEGMGRSRSMPAKK